MRKFTILFITMIFIGAMFAAPFNNSKAPVNTPMKPYGLFFEKLDNVKVSEPATYTGTVKEVYIELTTGFSKSRIVLETDEGKEVEIYVGTMWKFFEFKPGMKLEVQAVEVEFNEEKSFNVAFKIVSDGIIVELPFRRIKEKLANIKKQKLDYMKKLNYQKWMMLKKQGFKGQPMYQYGPIMPFYGNPYQYPPMGVPQQQMPYNNFSSPRGGIR